MIEFGLILTLLGLIPVIKLIVFIDAVRRIVVLFQIVGILVSYKVSVSVIQLGSLVIGLSASLVVSYKSVFIISRVQFFIELTVVISTRTSSFMFCPSSLVLTVVSLWLSSPCSDCQDPVM